MAGIYIHVPFCKKACYYCDFHFSTNLDTKNAMVKAIVKEMELRKDYLNQEEVRTIYFGGGTPSLLKREELADLIGAARQLFKVSADAEVTLEANPDDLQNPGIFKMLKEEGVNRLSIGIQSFYDEHLNWMNRAHNSSQAVQSVKMAQEAGFNNITIDLIYGIPGMTMEMWKENIRKALELNIQHISAYCLTVEEQTALHKMVKDGKVKEAPDTDVEEQVNVLVEELEKAGFERYEISNFCKPGMESRHNSSYWKGTHYLGLGPSAHSYNGTAREWNAPNNPIYIKQVNIGEGFSDTEPIDETTAYNEYVMTRLRTSWGVDFEEVKRKFAIDIEKDFEEELSYLIEDEEAVIENGILKLTHGGKFFADGIAASLFLERE